MKYAFSAGGVVYKKGEQTEILVCQHAQHKGWGFPKGIIGDTIKGEKKEETAVREVKEETGIDAVIQKELTPVSYWFQASGEKIKKTVYYFVMEHKGGDTENRDHEMIAVLWLPEEEVYEKLTYPSDKAVWKEAQKYLGGVA